MVDGMPSSVANAERVVGTVCVPCVDGKMVQAPHSRSSTKTTKCELVHTDVGGPLTESLGGSIYFITALEDSTGFITATPIKTKGIVGSRAHRISAAAHCTSAAFLRPSHFRKLRTTGLQMSSYVSPDAWILCKAMSSF